MHLFHHIVPIPRLLYSHGFSTNCMICGHVPDGSLYLCSLDLTELGAHKISSKTGPPSIVSLPDPVSAFTIASPVESHVESDISSVPSDAWEAVYLKGSVNPSSTIPGGFGFYLSGPKNFASKLAEGAKEVVMSYRVMFQNDWDWVKGGKLPGIFGGVGDLAYRCSGGRQEERCKCFDVRLMWRSEGAGELYVYLPPHPRNTERLLAVPPLSRLNNDYGVSVGRGSFTFVPGRWMSVAIRVKMNYIGKEDGELQLWIDGRPVIQVDGLIFRDSEQSIIKGMHFQTFFGGNKEDWASPKDQRAWFADVTGVIGNDPKYPGMEGI